MNPCIANSLNRQMVAELDSAHLYMQMAEWMHVNGFPGPGGWLRRQANEKVERAMTLFAFLRDRDAAVFPCDTGRGKRRFSSARDVTDALLAQGKRIAAAIRNLIELELSSDDGEVSGLIAWLSSVQLEEEELVTNVLLRVNSCRCDAADAPRETGLRVDIDPELAKLQDTIPSLLKSQRRHGVA